MSLLSRWMPLLLAALAATAAGCGSNEPEELVILCGKSFRPPMEELARMFEDETGVHVELVVGNSEDLLPSVEQHTKGDVFISHDPYMQYTEDHKALLRFVTVGYLAPALVVKKGNPKGIRSIEDLAKATEPPLGVVLMNPEYAECGKMTYALLEKKGIKEAVLKNVGNAVVRSHDVVATQIKLGHRDAGVMWNGMAHNWLTDIEIVPTPYEYDKEVRVGVIGLSYSPKKGLIEKFLAFSQRRGRKVFQEFGYVKTTQPGKEADDPLWGADVKDAKPLLLYCGAGIRPPVDDLIALLKSEYGIAVQADYGGSEKLLSRIKLVKQGDLFMPGDMHYVNKAEEDGLLASQQTVCYFVPVILVQKGNPHGTRTLRDLLKPDLKVGLGDPRACAVGHVSAEIFAKNGIADEDLEANVKYRSATVNDLGNHIKLKSLDAVIVWDAVAAYYADSAETIAIPPEQNVVATVSMAVLKSSSQPELAGKVAAFFASRRGKEVFQKHHYTIKQPKQ
jgi:molybdate transport system substrate-binding protein